MITDTWRLETSSRASDGLRKELSSFAVILANMWVSHRFSNYISLYDDAETDHKPRDESWSNHACDELYTS